jgi:hypothetical protein
MMHPVRRSTANSRHAIWRCPALVKPVLVRAAVTPAPARIVPSAQPVAGEERDSAKGRWGVVSNDAGGSRKNIAAGPIPPRGGRGNGTPIEDDGVVDPPSDVMDLRSANLDSKNYRCRTYTPGIPPPRRHASFHLLKDDGGGVNDLDLSRSLTSAEKKFRFAAGPPPNGTKRCRVAHRLG